MGLLFGFFWALALFCTCSFSLSPDGKTLLEMKSALNDSKHFLQNWIETDPTPCNWTGITCYLHDQTVHSINLPYMQLGGIISPTIGKLSRLQRLAFHQNSLHGSIPSEIKNCTGLKALYLRANYLQGSIPPELGSLSNLVILDLSSNSLRGSIPSSIGFLTHLRFLNLSTNFLSGEIPSVGVLRYLKNNSFTGNLDLCGLQVQKLCRASMGFPVVLPHTDSNSGEGVSAVPTKRLSHYLNGVLIGAMSTMGLALIVLLSFLWICLLSRKGKLGKKYLKVDKQLDQDTGAKLVTFHGDLPYSSHEIVKKLELLDDDDVVGSGGFGTVFKMVMDDCSAFAVKRIDKTREGSDQIFERELEILGSIKHINLVNLRGYCRLPSSKLLIYDYLSLGSLDHFLHEHGQEELPLNWNARLRIALGSARGLAYLHHDCCPRIVHRDIKSSNILLDKSLQPHVSDFGLAKLLVDDEANVTTVVAGTFGYLAPEYLHSGRATEKTDVYSFGVLLLELVTGKRPTDPSFVKKGLNVVGWMNTLVGENHLEEIVDKKCMGIDVETVEAVLDIAARCTDANPDNRPSMNRVYQILEEEVMSPCPSEFYDTHSDC
ncbi:leucine-rich repeat protein kinase family protein [Tasmannia lanceolata]|uniref:leucine-rich repeat protein kinase family protein n=1 Tax=Tasmannia lanceolata TaxID=3420 RepID=UPI004062D513